MNLFLVCVIKFVDCRVGERNGRVEEDELWEGCELKGFYWDRKVEDKMVELREYWFNC